MKREKNKHHSALDGTLARWPSGVTFRLQLCPLNEQVAEGGGGWRVKSTGWSEAGHCASVTLASEALSMWCPARVVDGTNICTHSHTHTHVQSYVRLIKMCMPVMNITAVKVHWRDTDYVCRTDYIKHTGFSIKHTLLCTHTVHYSHSELVTHPV